MRGKSILCIFLFSYLALPAESQPYGNEWINFNQQYYKVPVAENGVYRITFTDLQNAGINIANINPRRFQIYHRGKEIAIHVEGELDARFDPADYIEFFGVRNDGKGDIPLYKENAIPHTYYNLYSDTTSYFLTWRLDTGNGKRIPDFKESNINNIPSDNFHWQERLKLLTGNYSPGLHYPLNFAGAELLDAAFDFGEGWTGPAIRKGQSVTYSLDSIFNTWQNDSFPELEILFAGRNNLTHNISIYAGPAPSSTRHLADTTFRYHNNLTYKTNLAWSDIGTDGQVFIKVTVNGVNANDPDFVSVSYLKLRYPQLINIQGKSEKLFRLKRNQDNKSFIRITGWSSPGIIWDITDPVNIVNIGYDLNGGNLDAIIPGTASTRHLWYAEDHYNVTEIKKTTFPRIDSSLPDYIIIYHKDLTNPAAGYNNPVDAYANFRSSAAGGNFKVITFEINSVYDEFNYGEISPLSIRNLCRYLLDNGNPAYLLLIGKSLTVNYDYYRNQIPGEEFRDLVPTYGYPGSDVLFSAGLNGTTYEPAIPTGRLPARNSVEVANYLDKVKENLNFGFDELWKKDIVQLSGGLTTGELTVFKQYIDDFKSQEEGLYLGGSVRNINKQTNNTVELFNISEEVNKGKSLILFFGHSAPNITDIDIGNVSDPKLGYNNQGKYPFILVNGCDAGNIFNKETTFGEDWIVTGKKGALNFMAHSDVGYTPQLRKFTQTFLATGYEDSIYIDQSLGNIIKETGKRFLASTESIDLFYISQVQESVLQGDPANPLFGADLPDYAINSNDIFIKEPENLLTDSMKIGIILKNFGRADPRPFYVTVDRTLADGLKVNLEPVKFDPVFYRDTIYYSFYTDPDTGAGQNIFDIHVDPFDSIPEIRKTNNSVSFDYFITKMGTQNLFPYDYSIVDTSFVTLTAQAARIPEEERQFLFELDTTIHFNSSVRQTTAVTARNLVSWNVDPFKTIGSVRDSTVFFWRTSFADLRPGEKDAWSVSSFMYIDHGPTGWAQANLSQFTQNSLTGISYDSISSGWVFNNYESSIDLTTYGAENPDMDYEDVSLNLDGIPYIYATRLCTNNSINALAFDKITTNPYLVLKFGTYDILDRRSCGRQPQSINNFLNDEILGADDYLTQYINAVKEGDHVLLFTIGEVTFQDWPQSLRDKIGEIGASPSLIDALQNGEPLIILGQKGAPPGTATVVHADGSSATPVTEQAISLNTSIEGHAASANITSRLIGPAENWNTFYNRVSGIDSPGNESFDFDIAGIKNNHEEALIYSGITSTDLDINGINANTYPYLKLTYHTTDTAAVTPAILNYWIVSYVPLPEGVLLPAHDQPVRNIEKQEGEDLTANFIFHNISNWNFSDSIKVIFTNINQNTLGRKTDSLNIPPVDALSDQNFDITYNTRNLGGKNNLEIIANPNIIPERYYTNNFIRLEDFLNVQKDITNPFIDVSFDGRYILDGEIVSPSPLISIRMKDENKYLIKSDTTGIDIFLQKSCDGCQAARIAFSDPKVLYTPASDKNEFSIDYQPDPLDDGIYLLSVQATDESGNKSGMDPYEIHFEVVNESQISNFYPFPNPFSTSTRFVFTLTGSVIPDQLKIQIMTISGKVVREISQDELGPIHIGNNISEFAWNGRDEFGDQLANGVYLYRIIINNPGDNFKHRTTSGDRGFKKGFGKLYLLR